MTPKIALRDIIKAWDSLPGGHNYSPEKIEEWLIIHMGPAIKRAREVLK